MIAEATTRVSSSVLTIAVTLSASFPALCAGQNSPSVYTNPRAGTDDPRVGLKAGLYDAGEASFGMQRLPPLPEPAGLRRPPPASLPPSPPSPPSMLFPPLQRLLPAPRPRVARRLAPAPTTAAPTP